MMQAGKYYIGDLCYVMHDVWGEFCNLTIDGRRVIDGEFTLDDGREFATYTTAYGDGVYYPNVGGKCPVDAGLIGCIRVDDIKDETYDNASNPGIIVDFSSEFDTYKKDGVIHFGHVQIDTVGDDVYDDSEYEDDNGYY